MTRHHRSRRGAAYAVTRREVEWDDDQQAWMLALAEYRAQTCSGCGGYLPDTTHPDRALDGYVAGPPVRCGGCTALHREFPMYEKAEQPQALRFGIQPRQQS